MSKQMVESRWKAAVTRIKPRMFSGTEKNDGACQMASEEFSNAIPYDDEVDHWLTSESQDRVEIDDPTPADVNVVHLTFTPRVEEPETFDTQPSSRETKAKKKPRTKTLQSQLREISTPTIPKLSFPKWIRSETNEVKQGLESGTTRRWHAKNGNPPRKNATVQVPLRIQKQVQKKRTMFWPLRSRNQVRFQDPANTKVIEFSTNDLDASTIDSDDVTLNTLSTHGLNQVEDDQNSVMSDVIHTIEDVVMLQCDPISEMKPWLKETSKVLLSAQICR